MLKIRYWVQKNLSTLEGMEECWESITVVKNLNGRKTLPLPALGTKARRYREEKLVDSKIEKMSGRILYHGIKELPELVLNRPEECTLVSLSESVHSLRWQSKPERKTPVRFRIVWALEKELISPDFINILETSWKPPRPGRPRSVKEDKPKYWRLNTLQGVENNISLKRFDNKRIKELEASGQNFLVSIKTYPVEKTYTSVHNIYFRRHQAVVIVDMEDTQYDVYVPWRIAREKYEEGELLYHLGYKAYCTLVNGIKPYWLGQHS